MANTATRRQALDWRRQEVAVLEAWLDLEPENVTFRARWATQLEGQATLEAELGLLAESLATQERGPPGMASDPRAAGGGLRAAPRRHPPQLGRGSWSNWECRTSRPSCIEVALERRELGNDSAKALFSECRPALQKATAAATRAVDPRRTVPGCAAQCQQLAVALFRQAALADPARAAELARGQSHMQSLCLAGQLDAAVAAGTGNCGAIRSRAVSGAGNRRPRRRPGRL